MGWSEDIRPSTLDEVVGQDHIVSRLKIMVSRLHNGDGCNWPHMMFAGPPGVGKTSTALALMRSAFGESWKENWLELNASDERSISVIRSKVKEFASRGVIGSFSTDDGAEHPIPFNVVFLDEADNLTPDAQAALRRTMEKYKSTIFILSCNYPHKIIEPIQDRCAFSMARFQPIDNDIISDVVKTYATTRDVKFDEDAIEKLVEASNGSLRKATNLLQVVCMVPGKVVIGDVEEVVQQTSPKLSRKILGMVAKARKSSDPLRAYREIDAVIDKQLSRGMMASDILISFYQLTTAETGMPEQLRHRLLVGIGNALHHVSVSQDPTLALKCFVRELTL